MPITPSYPSTPFTGRLPSTTAMGPVDLLPTSSTSGYYQSRMDRPYGRNLAGLGQLPVPYRQESYEPDSDMGKLAIDLSTRQVVGHVPPDPERVLNQMAENDDVQGNGVFDPYATEPNVYPDTGVFAGRWNLPGYLAREQSFAPSEVLDVNGRPVVYVPGGAVSMDSAAQVAFLERGMYQQPQPVMQAQTDYVAPADPIANVAVGRRPVGPGIDQAFAGLGASPERLARARAGSPRVGAGRPARIRSLRGDEAPSAASNVGKLLAVAAAAAVVGYFIAKGGRK